MRAHFRDLVVSTGADGAVVPLAGASVTVYQTGTTTPITESLYSVPTGGSPLVNPIFSDSYGNVEFYLDTPKTVDLYIVKAGYTTQTITVTTQAPSEILLGDTTLSGAVASVSFSSIQSYYRALILRATVLGDDSANCPLVLRVNGLSSATYNWSGVKANNSTLAWESGLSDTSYFVGYMADSTTSARLGSAVIELLNPFDGTYHKQIQSRSGLSGTNAAATQYTQHHTGACRTTAVISSLTLFNTAGNLLAGRISLYGVP